MGLISSSYRMMYLMAYKNSLETKLQWIAESKMELAASSDEILALGSDLDPQNPAVKQLKARKNKLDALEKRLDMQVKEYQNRLQMIEAELKSCENDMSTEMSKSSGHIVSTISSFGMHTMVFILVLNWLRNLS